MTGRDEEEAIDQMVGRTLVNALYSSPASLVNGAVATVGAACAAAWVSGTPELWFAAIALAVIACVRILASLGLSPEGEDNSTTVLEVTYEIGAFSFALALGLDT